jgi:hypothetical protein
MNETKTPRLSERAILIRLSTHEYTAKKKDKALSEEICRRKNADSDVVDAVINLVPKSRLKAVNIARGRVYRRHKELTLPWMRGGLDILPSDMFFDYREQMKKVIKSHTNEVQLLKADWPNVIAKNKSRFGDIPEAQLPTAADLDRLFSIETDIMPVPETADFRAVAGDDEVEAIKTQVEKTFEAGVEKYTQELYGRLGELVAKVHETMSERDKGFRDSLITNLKTFCARIPKYNLSDDKDLEDIRKNIMDELAGLDPEDLREIPNQRKKAAKSAEDILAKIAEYGGA